MQRKFKIEQFDSQVIPLSPDDLLQLTTIAVSFPIVIEIEGTALDLSGALVPFRFVQNISATITPTTNQFRLGYSALLSVVVHTRTASIPDGDCYCRLTLVKSLSRSVYPARKLLTEGYLATYASIGYGSSSINGAPSDHYFIQNIALADPAAGNDVAFIIPVFTEVIVQIFSFTLVCSVNVVNRIPSITITLPGGASHILKYISSITASQTVRFFCSAQLIDLANAANNIVKLATPTLTLNNGATLSSSIGNLNVTDQITDASVLLKRKTVPF